MPCPTGAPTSIAGGRGSRASCASCFDLERRSCGASARRPSGPRGARRVRDERGRGRVGLHRAVDRLGVEERVERRARRSGTSSPTTNTSSSAGRSGRSCSRFAEEVEVAEAVSGHEQPRARLAEDELDLLRSVEVDDRHRHGAEQRDGPEGRRGFGPVRDLERDRHPARRPRPAARPPTRRAKSEASANVPRHGRTSERNEITLLGALGEAGGEDRAEGLVGPQPFGHVALGPVAVVGPRSKSSGHGRKLPTTPVLAVRAGRNSVPVVRNIVPRRRVDGTVEQAVAARTLQRSGRRLRRRGAPAPRRRVRGDAPHRRHRPAGERHRAASRAVEPGLLPPLPRARTRCSLAVLDDGQRRLVVVPRARAWREPSPARRGSARGSKACSSRPATPTPPRTRGRSRSTARGSPTGSRRSMRARASSARRAVACRGRRGGRRPDATPTRSTTSRWVACSDALVRRERPTTDEVEHLVEFALARDARP